MHLPKSSIDVEKISTNPEILPLDRNFQRSSNILPFFPLSTALDFSIRKPLILIQFRHDRNKFQGMCSRTNGAGCIRVSIYASFFCTNDKYIYIICLNLYVYMYTYAHCATALAMAKELIPVLCPG